MEEERRQQISVIYIRNPFDPYGSRDLAEVDWRPGASLADYMADLAPADEYALSLNGGQVTLELRPSTYPSPGDQLVVCPVVEGGGGGAGKNMLRALAMIVVVIVSIVAPYAAPAAWGLTTAGGGLTLAGAGVSAGIAMGGSMLVNALLPAPKVDAPDFGGSPSPTYGWNGAQTTALQGIPIPVVYGTMRVPGNRIPAALLQELEASE